MHIKNNLLLKCLLIIAVLLIAAYLTSSQLLSQNNYAQYRYESFWNDPDQYDVWFMGSSHSYYSVYPMKLYESCGITSYDIATPSSTLPMTYWTLMNALEAGTPEVVFVDVYHIDMEETLVSDLKKIHNSFDAMPLTATKINAIRDLVSDSDLRRELYFPAFRRNGKYESLTRADLPERFKLNKGAKLDTDIDPVKPKQSSEELHDGTTGTLYLKKIINECESRNIDLVITAFPFNGDDIKLHGLNTGISIAEDYGVPTLDMSYCTDLIDYRYEFSQDGHLNYSGSVKMTEFIGDYLTENYELEDHRKTDDSIRKKWNQDLVRYKNYLIGKLKTEKKLREHLLMCSDKNAFELKIYISDNADYDSVTGMILEDLAPEQFLTYKQASAYSGRHFDCDVMTVISDADSSEIVDISFFDNGKRVNGN